MALKAVLTASEFAEIAEQIREHYTPEGDNYALDTDIVQEDTQNLKSALKSERDARKLAEKTARETINKYKDVDPDKYAAALTSLEEIERKRLEEAGEYETLKSSFATDKQAAIDAVRNEFTPQVTKLSAKVEKLMIDNVLQSEFVAQGGKGKATEAFVTLARPFVELASDSDDLTVVIKDNQAKDIPELVTNLKGRDDFGLLFDADVATGGGASPQPRTGGGSPTGLKRSDMTDEQKALYIRNNGGQAAYEKLPW